MLNSNSQAMNITRDVIDNPYLLDNNCTIRIDGVLYAVEVDEECSAIVRLENSFNPTDSKIIDKMDLRGEFDNRFEVERHFGGDEEYYDYIG